MDYEGRRRKPKIDETTDAHTEVQKLLRIVECPVCRECPTSFSPIYNCVNGHFVCSTCRPKLQVQKCAYCQGSFTKIRNYPLENVVNSQIFACKYVNYGCRKYQLCLSEYEDHVKKCWAKYLEPGKIKIIPKDVSHDDELLYLDEDNLYPCPRCQFTNPPRKLKCIDCSHNLRVPTPMYLPIDEEDLFNSLGSNGNK